MNLFARSFISDVTSMQHETVATWHKETLSNPYENLIHLACTQHQFNFQLWHEEDIARSQNVGDARIAEVKRAIDGFNQNRNDWIEKIDAALIELLVENGVTADPNSPLNTETPGSAVDRLSILSLRMFHLHEELERGDATQDHREKVAQRLLICDAQHADLSNSLVELLDAIFSGQKQLKLYRQLKMYNDPSLNPYLYDRRKAG